VNVSRSGLGLVCTGGEGLLREGDSLGLKFQLPGSGQVISAQGTIMWLYTRPAVPEGPETAIGVWLTAVASSCRGTFERYLLEHRFNVAIGLATDEDIATLQDHFADQYKLHFEDTAAGLLDLVERGDISAVLVCGDDAEAATSLVNRMYGHLLTTYGADVLPPDMMPAVIYAAQGSPSVLIQLFNAGRLFRTLVRPLRVEDVRLALQEACNAHGAKTEQRRATQALERALARQRERPLLDAVPVTDRIVFTSPAMQRIIEVIRTVAAHKISVLLTGETGTGKEVLATLIHETSDRAAAAFVIQDCGVLTETLLESELFGHVKGAFTGAVAHNPGLFVMADGGTIFLDEIENTTPDLQAKLLRVIETGMVRPVGGARVRHVDVRVVAASNRDLREEVDAGRFRADLFYRLSTFPIRIPPLRERPEDVLPLAEHFLRLANQRFETRVTGLTSRAVRALSVHTWPGNIRELRNTIESAVLLCEGDQPIDLAVLPETIASPDTKAAPLSLRERVAHYERQVIHDALVLESGVIRRAARRLRASPVTLRRKAIAYGLLT
jgi:transcriptional regulator with PAS, ATPase and Fis domain